MMQLLCEKDDVLRKPLYMLVISAVQGFCVHMTAKNRKSEGHHMYGHISRDNHIGREIKLVRTTPFDNRVKRHMRGERTKAIAKRIGVLLLAVLLFLVICRVTGAVTRETSGQRVHSGESTQQESIEQSGVQIPPEVQLQQESQPQQGTGARPDLQVQPGIGVQSDAQTPVTSGVADTQFVQKTPLIVIDPGHGGMDEGGSYGEIWEKDVNLQLALALSDKLTDMGYEVVLTRQDNETKVSLEERVEIANRQQADLFLSIHQNVSGEPSVHGLETYYCEKDTEGNKRFAILLHNGAVEKTDAKDRGLKENSKLYVLRETFMPACLIETGFLTNEKEREALCSEEYQKKLVEGMAQGIDLYFHPKTMYLTFDDGPSEENTSEILDILKKHNIKATFFVIGENVRKYPEVAKRIVEEGHTIGIHCDHHNYKELYESVESFLYDFEQAYRTVYEVTGVEVQLFRFPGGSINAYNETVYQEIIAEMSERGFIYFDWNASLEDAKKNTTPEKLLQNAKESTLKRKKVVMLAHDIVYNTAACLEDLIEQFPEYQMEPLTAQVKPVVFKGN